MFSLIGKVSGQYGPDAPNRSRSKKGYPSDGFSVGADQADFSSFAVELARIGSELRNVPDVRQEEVDRLRSQVQAGEYVPPLDKVARRLVLAGILESQ